MSEKPTNKVFAKESTAFKKACEKASVEATSRQASKYRNKKGVAYKGTH